MLQLGILGSTRGTNMLGIIDAINNQELNARIAIVISNKKAAPILERARVHGIKTQFINPEGLSREAYDQQLNLSLKENAVDLIVLIGFMRILSATFVNDWKNKIINVHPSLLPAHAGKMDLAVHASVLAAEEKITGCSVHLVTEEVDAGRILVQKSCPVFSGDSVTELKERVQSLETPALIEAIRGFAR